MYTEREAIEKQCAEVYTNNPAIFHVQKDRCQASECMHWRWTRLSRLVLHTRFFWSLYPYYIKGYCGKSGRP